jgi:fumarate hydratase subunit beta
VRGAVVQSGSPAVAPRALRLPLSAADVQTLHAGDTVLLSGPLLTARDAAHQRLAEALRAGQPLPVTLAHETIYYTGPTPARPGMVIGAAGPTTAYRMDPYTPALLAAGVRAMIGKGARGPGVCAALQQFGAVYFAAIGGAGAFLRACISACTLVAYADLGTEAIYRLTVEAFPAIVAHDAHGSSVYAAAA